MWYISAKSVGPLPFPQAAVKELGPGSTSEESRRVSGAI